MTTRHALYQCAHKVSTKTNITNVDGPLHVNADLGCIDRVTFMVNSLYDFTHKPITVPRHCYLTCRFRFVNEVIIMLSCPASLYTQD